MSLCISSPIGELFQTDHGVGLLVYTRPFSHSCARPIRIVQHACGLDLNL